MRDTSLLAYLDLELGPRQKQVLAIIRALGCPTNLEMSKFLQIPINQITPRTNELVKLGFVKECEKRTCSISGRLAISWRLA